jgi:hypothetical protein
VNIIPLRIENTIPTKTLEYFISAPHWLDALTAPLEQHIARLAGAVKALLAKAERDAAAPPAPPAPPATETLQAAPAPVAAAPPPVPPQPPAVIPPASVFTPASLPPEAPVDDAAPRSRRGLAIAALIACAALVGGVVVSRRAPREARPETASAGASAPAVPTPAPASASGEGAAAPPPLPASTPAASAAETVPAPVRTAVKAVPNLLIDFRNTVDEGSIALEVDGKKIWSELLGRGMKDAGAKPEGAASSGAPQGPVSAGLALRAGDHQASVTLVDENGKVRDTQSISLTVAKQAAPQTLQIRLSRFKKDLQLKLVDAQTGQSAGSPK